jgi:hypothetical protein
MSVATEQAKSYFRYAPLHDKPEAHEARELNLSEVPKLSDVAVVGKITGHSIRYDAGRESWWVSLTDKAVIRAYRKRRTERDIEAGASPILEYYVDEKGQL